ncbi:MAG TPA: DNA translocase FtsK [Gammaproteobacteria bacterium]|nr:DNA translocase FtsK [Gammaproteobacteria bacterium]
MLLILGAIAIYMLISLLTYNPSDPGWAYSASTNQVTNAGGIVGAWFSSLFLFYFGYLAYLFPVMTLYAGWLIFHGRYQDMQHNLRRLLVRTCGFLLTLITGAGITTLHFTDPSGRLPTNPGGILGDIVATLLVTPFNFLGATLFLLALFLTGISLFTGLSWFSLMDSVGRITLSLAARVAAQGRRFKNFLDARQVRKQRAEAVKVENIKKKKRPKPKIEPLVRKPEKGLRVEKEKQVPLFTSPDNGDLPPLSLLDEAEPPKNPVSEAALEAISRQLELKLQDFGVEVEVVAVHPGPVITRYELQPAPGVKVSQISNLAKDLARALSAISVRIVDVIPGKSVIGVEIPNEYREIVRLSEILQSRDFEKTATPLPLALGKDISGHPVVVDLIKMPHLLIAGTTGSGKSVAINAMILSLLYNASPRDMRLIMIDPKMLELSIYEGIPHLLAPVVTDMKEAANALRWCVGEMERRYRLMAFMGVRNIANFNKKIKAAAEEGTPIRDPFAPPVEGEEAPELSELPYIVVIVDELADMMMMVGKKVEQLIARLAQKARASGIHLVLATQRPSVDVITGLIKANIPTRIAFQVSSKIDSRTILDQMGAEQLLGHGDMLYLPAGTSVPTRIHGAFVDDHEVHKVVDNLKQAGEPNYLDEILEGGESEGDGNGFGGDGEGETDALYDQAVRIVTETRKASISGVQRRLKIGYNRAARIIEEMERAGVVSPMESNGSREVLAPPPPPDN